MMSSSFNTQLAPARTNSAVAMRASGYGPCTVLARRSAVRVEQVSERCRKGGKSCQRSGPAPVSTDAAHPLGDLHQLHQDR